MERLTLCKSFLVAILAAIIYPNLVLGYDVYWNVPTELCKKRHNITFDFVSEYGIKINKNDNFKGDKVTILYSPGLWPEVKGYVNDRSLKVPDMSELTVINGGLPQSCSKIQHLEAFQQAINISVPNRRYDGIIIIDMEHFGATWNQNFNDMEIYRILSRKKVRDQHPKWSLAEIEAQAILEYERATTSLLIGTLKFGKVLRPYAKWGYYQYPECYNVVGEDFCSEAVHNENDQMIQFWRTSDALFPSLYLPKEGTYEEKALRTKGRVQEALRVFEKINKTNGLVLPYITYSFYFNSGFIDDMDMENLIAVPKKTGADGVVIWGSSFDIDTKKKCLDFQDYVKNTIGPISKKYIE